MPADLSSTIILILLNAADVVGRLWPYVVGGIGAAALLLWGAQGRRWPAPSWVPRPLFPLLAAVAGVVSPLPTLGMAPLMLQLHAEGLPGAAALAFVLASSLTNPQMFLLTLGALGARFALAQLASVLLLSVGLGLALGNKLRAGYEPESPTESERPKSPWTQLADLAGHVGLYFLIGVIVGAALQVLLPQLGALNWLGRRGWLSTPALGWLGAPLYTCGGSAIPLASSLVRTGFSPGAMFSFLLVGPALRGTTLAALGCILPRRAQAICLTSLALTGGLMGYGFDWLVGVT